jgi:beta-glucosidase
MVLTGHLDPAPPIGQRNTPEHQALAREMAEAGMTLLKNEGELLPLDPARVRKIAVLGPKAKRRNCWPLWGGSTGVWPPYEVTPWQGLQDENGGRFNWVKSPGDADVVLLFVGVGHRPGFDSEAMDRKSLNLPDKQQVLIRETVKANPNTVVVLTNGGPLSMPWLDRVPAVLETWYPGMEGGTAIARALFGDLNPSGKLPVTFPRKLEDSPAHASSKSYPGDKQTVHYDEELLVGYRHFDRRGIEPLFPFGHGLSYTRFEYGELQLSGDSFAAEDTLSINMMLTNTGERAGAEVVQLYVADHQAEEDRPPQALKGFTKMYLEPGETAELHMELPLGDLAVFCPEANGWEVRPGRYSLYLGGSSRDIRQQREIQLENRSGRHPVAS